MRVHSGHIQPFSKHTTSAPQAQLHGSESNGLEDCDSGRRGTQPQSHQQQPADDLIVESQQTLVSDLQLRYALLVFVVPPFVCCVQLLTVEPFLMLLLLAPFGHDAQGGLYRGHPLQQFYQSTLYSADLARCHSGLRSFGFHITASLPSASCVTSLLASVICMATKSNTDEAKQYHRRTEPSCPHLRLPRICSRR